MTESGDSLRLADAADARTTRVAGVVLVYRPDDDVVTNVRALQEQVSRVYVVNNSPGAASAVVTAALDSDKSIVILDQAGNVGVAAGFNAGMRAALMDGHEYVCIFDQDSRVTEGMIARLIAAGEDAGALAGIIAPALRSAATGAVYRRESGKGIGESDVVISSGSLFSRSLVERIGLHDEPLFIDYVDHDICLRARRAGLRNLKVYDAILDHRFGDSDPVRFFGRWVYLANYSLTRIFYQTRNRIIVIRRYGFGRWFREDLWFTAKAWTKLLLLERDRVRKVGAALRGTHAGLTYPARERRW